MSTSEQIVSTESRATAVAWSKDDPFGAEHAEVAFDDDALTASGIAISNDPLPYRLDYSLRTGPSFVTAEVEASSRGEGWKRSLKLVRSKAGEWNAETATVGEAPLPPPGGDTQLVDGALDPDLGLSPLFNDGGSVDDFLMVWISVPDLAIHPSPQRYTYLETLADGNRLVRFEFVGEGEDFVADIVLAANGLVVDYPGIATRIR
jgi:hypothetical protein